MASNPILTGSPEERRRKLGEHFSLMKVVFDALIKEKLQDLEECRFFFDCETIVAKWTSKLSLEDEASIQAARVRCAWHAAPMNYRTFEQDRSKAAITGLHSLLDESERHTFKQNFGVRYKCFHCVLPR